MKTVIYKGVAHKAVKVNPGLSR